MAEGDGDVDDRGERRLAGDRCPVNHRAGDELPSRPSSDRPREYLGTDPAIGEVRGEPLELELGTARVGAEGLNDHRRVEA